MSVLPPFRLERPETLEEAISLLSWDDVPYVGGTELLLAMRSGLLRPDSLIDLKQIPVLQELSVTDDALTIGGAVTHQTVIDNANVVRSLPVLTRTLRQVGNPRVRAAGTLAGNLCFAEPKSDVIPLLIALDASVRLQGPEGIRELPVSEFVVGPYAASKEPDELLTSIHVPISDRQAVYVKYQTAERPTVGVAAVRSSDEGETRTVVVVGASGEIPVRYEADGEVDADAVADLVSPIPDLTGSADYKRRMTAVFVRRAIARLEEAVSG